eukprot:Transcript_5194.p1 GENE.Transcript_5194~~Transcript_5194.p1  ORF type:complete len:347 (+),score=138.43 Transcript_5194:164-1204(+)
MKFGKHLKASATAGWVYLDYKALKKLLKQLQALPESSDQREGAERRFMEELWNGIAQVNAFFVDKERSLLAELQNSADDDASRAELYGQVSDLRSHVILNYLAVLKIAKKHDKHSVNPLRAKAIDHMSGLAFYLSLEHSYLFAECKHHLQADIDAKLVVYVEDEAVKGVEPGAPRPRMWRPHSPELTRPASALSGAAVEGELEVPAHFERCLVTGEREPLYDEPGARAVDQSPVNLEISRMLGLIGTRSAKYEVPATASTPTAVRAAAGGADARFPRGDGATTAVAAPRYAPSRQPTGTAGEAAAATTARPAGRGGARHGAARRPPVNALDEDMIFDMSECSGAES